MPASAYLSLNPFLDTSVGEGELWGTREWVDVPEIHATQFAELMASLDMVRGNRRTKVRFVRGAGGSGKSHLFARLRRHYTDSIFYAYAANPPLQCEALEGFILNRVVASLRQPARLPGGAVAPYSQLRLLAYALIKPVIEQELAMPDLNRAWAGMPLEERKQLLHDALLLLEADHPQMPRSVLRTLLTVLREDKENLAAQWLGGAAYLTLEDLKYLGAPEPLRHENYGMVIQLLGRLAGRVGMPFVLILDQLDLITSPGQFDEFQRLLFSLMDQSENWLVFIGLVAERFTAWETGMTQALLGRIGIPDGNVGLGFRLPVTDVLPIGNADKRALLHARLRAKPLETQREKEGKVSAIYPLTDDEFSRLTSGGAIFPRHLLAAAGEVFARCAEGQGEKMAAAVPGDAANTEMKAVSAPVAVPAPAPAPAPAGESGAGAAVAGPLAASAAALPRSVPVVTSPPPLPAVPDVSGMTPASTGAESAGPALSAPPPLPRVGPPVLPPPISGAKAGVPAVPPMIPTTPAAAALAAGSGAVMKTPPPPMPVPVAVPPPMAAAERSAGAPAVPTLIPPPASGDGQAPGDRTGANAAATGSAAAPGLIALGLVEKKPLAGKMDEALRAAMLSSPGEMAAESAVDLGERVRDLIQLMAGMPVEIREGDMRKSYPAFDGADFSASWGGGQVRILTTDAVHKSLLAVLERLQPAVGGMLMLRHAAAPLTGQLTTEKMALFTQRNLFHHVPASESAVLGALGRVLAAMREGSFDDLGTEPPSTRQNVLHTLRQHPLLRSLKTWDLIKKTVETKSPLSAIIQGNGPASTAALPAAAPVPDAVQVPMAATAPIAVAIPVAIPAPSGVGAASPPVKLPAAAPPMMAKPMPPPVGKPAPGAATGADQAAPTAKPLPPPISKPVAKPIRPPQGKLLPPPSAAK